MDKKSIVILSIESSCDDTSAAVIRDGLMLSNVTAGQKVHEEYGGVVPELASRAHQQNIVPVVDAALKRAGVAKEELSAIAFTRGPGLLGSLLVGTSFAKGLALSLNIPLIDVNHLQGHVLAHFVKVPQKEEIGEVRSAKVSPQGAGEADGKHVVHELPKRGDVQWTSQSSLSEGGLELHFPFLCLLVSGGNSQILRVNAYNDMQILGQTIDDAAGEAFDKCAKVMGLPYPGGPLVDKLAKEGNPDAFVFAKPNIPGLDYSFSGLKTSFLYFLRDHVKENPNFIEENKADLCAGLQKTIIDILMKKLRQAVKETGIKQVAVAGGVSANSGLRDAFIDHGKRYGWQVFIPPFSFTTDNAAMIAQAAYFKYQDNDFCPLSEVPFARVTV